MKSLLTFLISWLPFCLSAQTNLTPHSIVESVQYVYLNYDTLITGTELYKEQFEGQDYIYLDGQTYKTQTVKFFKNEYGLFANTTSFYTSGLFAEATEIGKLNLFELNHEILIPIQNEFGEFETITRLSNYYNIGFGDLKRPTYDNLVIDLVDNPQAVLHLNKYNSVNKKRNTLFVLSGVFAVGAVAGIGSGVDYGLGIGLVAALASTACLVTGSFLMINKRNHLQKAIQVYNF
jgi:hypothetical protein